ncbi:MAG: MAG1210 family protein [Marinifilaceae bacterium]
MNFEDINEPVSLYEKQYKEKHAQNTLEHFENLLKTSKIDLQSNKILVFEIDKLKEKVANLNKKLSRHKLLRIITIITFIGILIGGYVLLQPILMRYAENNIIQYLIIATGMGVFGLLVFAIIKVLKSLSGKINNFKQYIEDNEKIINLKTNEAWEQLRPLNALFEWDTISQLVMKTIPAFTLDKYFSNARLEQLVNHFGLAGESHQDNSMLSCQSGSLNGNPFVMCESKTFEWGVKQYTGSLRISWRAQEPYTDSNGRMSSRTVTKTQTIYATIERPVPVYDIEKFLIYGNEAAPDLSFSRVPSKLSGNKGSLSSKRLKEAMKRHAKNVRKNDAYTSVANKEFDTTFAAKDRDNEVQFRLLFTALGQKEMLNLLTDKNVGFGDDFMFRKQNMINVVQPLHLLDMDLSCSPSHFHSYDFDTVKKAFIEYSNQYFKHFYFAFSPIFAIPLYQQHRSDIDIYKDVYSQGVSTWDCESIVNTYGEAKFMHPESITDNILKVEMNPTSTETIVDVTAHGFRGEERLDYISKLGGDGRYHNVPVEWIEYIPVKKVSPLILKEVGNYNRQEYIDNIHNSKEWKEFYTARNISFANTSFHKSIISFIPE